MYTLHQVKVLVQLLSKKRILGLIFYFKYKYQIFFISIQGPSKGSNSCNMIYIWFLFTPRKNLLNGENTKSVCCCCCYDPLKNTAKRLLLLLGFFFLSFFFLFLLLWFENWCVQNLLFLFLSLSLNFNLLIFLSFSFLCNVQVSDGNRGIVNNLFLSHPSFVGFFGKNFNGNGWVVSRTVCD